MLLCNANEHLHLHVLSERDFIFPAVVTQQSKQKKDNLLSSAQNRTSPQRLTYLTQELIPPYVLSMASFLYKMFT